MRKNPKLDRPRIYIDFNNFIEDNLYLLSRNDTKVDSEGNQLQLHVGMKVSVYENETDSDGNENNLIADGVVEENHDERSRPYWKWCIRVNDFGLRNISEL